MVQLHFILYCTYRFTILPWRPFYIIHQIGVINIWKNNSINFCCIEYEVASEPKWVNSNHINMELTHFDSEASIRSCSYLSQFTIINLAGNTSSIREENFIIHVINLIQNYMLLTHWKIYYCISFLLKPLLNSHMLMHE